MTDVRFAFSGEGPSDEALIDVVERLLLELGASSAAGFALRPPGKSVPDRVLWAARNSPPVQFLLVHRDADAPTPTRSLSEFTQARDQLEPAQARLVIPLVPVQETEAWLLCDEAAIREVVGNRRGREPLDLPRLGDIERTTSPKELLWDVLRRANGRGGRRALSLSDLSDFRRLLLQGLRVEEDAPVRQLRSFATLVQNLRPFAG